MTTSRPAASTQVHTILIHMDSRMPRKTTPARTRRKPNAMAGATTCVTSRNSARFAGKHLRLRGDRGQA